MGAVTFRSRVGSPLASGTGLLQGATVPGCVLQPPVPGLVRRDLRLVAGRTAEIGTDLPDYRELDKLFARCQIGSSRS